MGLRRGHLHAACTMLPGPPLLTFASCVLARRAHRPGGEFPRARVGPEAPSRPPRGPASSSPFPSFSVEGLKDLLVGPGAELLTAPREPGLPVEADSGGDTSPGVTASECEPGTEVGRLKGTGVPPGAVSVLGGELGPSPPLPNRWRGQNLQRLHRALQSRLRLQPEGGSRGRRDLARGRERDGGLSILDTAVRAGRRALCAR